METPYLLHVKEPSAIGKGEEGNGKYRKSVFESMFAWTPFLEPAFKIKENQYYKYHTHVKYCFKDDCRYSGYCDIFGEGWALRGSYLMNLYNMSSVHFANQMSNRLGARMMEGEQY